MQMFQGGFAVELSPTPTLFHSGLLRDTHLVLFNRASGQRTVSITVDGNTLSTVLDPLRMTMFHLEMKNLQVAVQAGGNVWAYMFDADAS